ncbi:uncharacterized protein LOC111010550 [Momordica charantia]|uniref:Uncharacterized protein LOC111010550 n=1 Tax=Momordica charantia TaxID=3673 RepID=A0A6J1CGB1_MOMCH|nr:uncharacterized protein LOC111010550 [Momordica charantia]
MAKSNSTNNSQISCSRGRDRSADGDRSPEESGWTIYFEDFLNSSDHQQLSSFSSDGVAPDDQPHVAPDAASSVVGDNDVAVPGLSCKVMNGFKKRRMMIKEVFVEDESLEDTASSPVNSPKV